MEYDNFLKEYETMNKWDDDILSLDFQYSQPLFGSQDSVTFSGTDTVSTVHHPPHYTHGKTEAIDIIEGAIKEAPDPVDGMLQAQVLKYMLRLWLKQNPKEDAQKARWYLDRLIEKL